MADIGLAVPESGFAHSVDEALEIAEEIGWPIIIRPSFILGGAGTGIADNAGDFTRLAAEGIDASPIGEILVEKSIAGWKEYELEVMRDAADNCVVICGIENFDPMGVHTGDSITVAPIQTLSDVEYQAMRDDAFAVLRRVGVETGGSNVQFAVNPDTGERLVIEMNPARESFERPGVEGDGLSHRQDRRQTRRGLHPQRDRERHHEGDPRELRAGDRLRGHQDPALGLREVARRDARTGHADAVGGRGDGDRTHLRRIAAKGDSLARAGSTGLRPRDATTSSRPSMTRPCGTAAWWRPPSASSPCTRSSGAGRASRRWSSRTRIDPWFIEQLMRIIDLERELSVTSTCPQLDARDWRRFKQAGFSDPQIAILSGQRHGERHADCAARRGS